MSDFSVEQFMGDIEAAARCYAPAGFAEDVAQDAAVKLWKWLESAVPADHHHVRMTARKIVRQCSMETAAFEKRKKRDSRRTIGGDVVETVSAATAGAEAADRIGEIRAAIDQLPERLANCMREYLFGAGWETKTGTGRGLVNRGKKKLQVILVAAGIYEVDESRTESILL